MIVDDPSHSFLQRCTAKIEQQPDGLLSQAQIGQQLLCMDSIQSLDRFYLDKQSFVYEQVDPECGIESRSLKDDVDGPLSRNGIAHLRELARKHDFINAFEQSRP